MTCVCVCVVNELMRKELLNAVEVDVMAKPRIAKNVMLIGKMKGRPKIFDFT